MANHSDGLDLPLAGVRVVELGIWVAGPAAGGLLADWGADVIKLEALTGDPVRGMTNPGMDGPVNPPFEMDNRGKRSIAVDLAHPEGRAVAARLLERADVFLSNLRLPALARLGMDADTLTARYPRLIYGRITGYGPEGPDADRAAFDAAAFWSRAGFMATMTEPGGDPPIPRGGVGDHTTGMGAAGAIAAALYRRERTGRGGIVDVSLYRAGIYVMSWDLAMHLRSGRVAPQTGWRRAPNPINNVYEAGDGRWFFLMHLQADRGWPGVCAAIERPDLLTDPRFADLRTRRRNAVELIEMLAPIFRSRPLAEWAPRFDAHDVWWAPVLTVPEVAADPQAAAAHAWVDAPGREGASVRLPAGPADFDGVNARVARMAPELGEHTETVLLDLGYTWDEIAGLKDEGAVL
jgi:crotonobetainyl-CoA:carnitine CoA-transferase CaiB-like acyl-CoA transferase